jgi:hypothetical protein
MPIAQGQLLTLLDRLFMGKLCAVAAMYHRSSVLRYVGNKMATFVMQSMGCDVSAINTVHYSRNSHDGSEQC